ncbi:MAG: hypothetical protein IJX26_04120, partial [Clostridia bacterium]|nr:hypothetical protein [Clostridia bacterium]
MLKIIGFELKKLVSRPGIYILSVLLAILLTVSLFIYEPEKNIQVYNTLDGSSITEISTNFKSNYKDSYDNDLSSALALATQISTNSASANKTEINDLISDLEYDVEQFYDTSVNALATENQKINALKRIRNSDTSLGSFDKLYSSLVTKLGTSETTIHYAVVTRPSYNKIINSLTEIQNNFDTTLETKEYTAMAKKAYSEFVPEIKTLVDLIKFPQYLSVATDFISNGNYYLLTKERLEIVLREMEVIENKVAEKEELNKDEDLIDEYNDLFNDYRLIIKNYTTLLTTSINVCLLEEFSPSEQTNLQFINNINYYTEKETQARYTYFIEEDKTELDYAYPLSFDVTSNGETSAYDYSYFALSIFSVALIVFAVMLASHSIAGENKEGTLRFVAI